MTRGPTGNVLPVTEIAESLTVTTTPAGSWTVRAPINGGPARTVFQWHADRALWCSGTDHPDDRAQPACTEPVRGLTEEPTSADDAKRIVAEWLEA